MTTAFEQKNTELARRCLALIRDIAERGASLWDPEDVGYALQELSQVLLERLGIQDRVFEPGSRFRRGSLPIWHVSMKS